MSDRGREQYEAVVVGGGFYGCLLAVFMREYFDSVAIVEKEDDLLTRASYVNQARVHRGYHYPRSLMTALRSFVNFPRFVADFKECIDDSFQMIYAIAGDSKVTASQSHRIYTEMGAPIDAAPTHHAGLFDATLVEEVFVVEECSFDADKLRVLLKERLDAAGIDVLYGTQVTRVTEGDNGRIEVSVADADYPVTCRYAVNCTYAQINTILRASQLPLLPFKHELCEIALIEVPDELKNLGVTVVDGPFFSTTPFPARGVNSLYHARYSPHHYWCDTDDFRDAHRHLERLELRSNYPFMIRDASRYLPVLRDATHVDSIYEVRTVLMQNEMDDGRPILLRADYGIRNFSVVLGGKLDNLYDVVGALRDTREFDRVYQ